MYWITLGHLVRLHSSSLYVTFTYMERVWKHQWSKPGPMHWRHHMNPHDKHLSLSLSVHLCTSLSLHWSSHEMRKCVLLLSTMTFLFFSHDAEVQDGVQVGDIPGDYEQVCSISQYFGMNQNNVKPNDWNQACKEWQMSINLSDYEDVGNIWE